MTTNELKKGARIQLRNGWYATLCDNKKGNTRVADVEGICRETGSVYSHDIMRAKVGEQWVEIEHIPAQLKLKKTADAMGF